MECSFCREEKRELIADHPYFICDQCVGVFDARLGNSVHVESAESLALRYHVPTIDLAEYPIPRDVLELVPRTVCKTHCVLPVSRVGECLVVAMLDPTDRAALAALAVTGLKIEPVIATHDALRAALDYYFK